MSRRYSRKYEMHETPYEERRESRKYERQEHRTGWEMPLHEMHKAHPKHHLEKWHGFFGSPDGRMPDAETYPCGWGHHCLGRAHHKKYRR